METFVLLSKSAKGGACVQLIQDALAHQSVYVFGELLQLPNIIEMSSSPQYTPHYHLLQLFAFGTYVDYKYNPGLPPLTPPQLRKLKHLTIVSMSGLERTLLYSKLMECLDISNVRELEDLIIDAIYTGIIKGKLDQKRSCLEVEYAMGRDLKPGQAQEVLETFSQWADTSLRVLKTLDFQMEQINEEFASVTKAKEEHERAVEDVKKDIKLSSRTGATGEFDYDPRQSHQFMGMLEGEGGTARRSKRVMRGGRQSSRR